MCITIVRRLFESWPKILTLSHTNSSQHKETRLRCCCCERFPPSPPPPKTTTTPHITHRVGGTNGRSRQQQRTEFFSSGRRGRLALFGCVVGRSMGCRAGETGAEFFAADWLNAYSRYETHRVQTGKDRPAERRDSLKEAVCGGSWRLSRRPIRSCMCTHGRDRDPPIDHWRETNVGAREARGWKGMGQHSRKSAQKRTIRPKIAADDDIKLAGNRKNESKKRLPEKRVMNGLLHFGKSSGIEWLLSTPKGC